MRSATDQQKQDCLQIFMCTFLHKTLRLKCNLNTPGALGRRKNWEDTVKFRKMKFHSPVCLNLKTLENLWNFHLCKFLLTGQMSNYSSCLENAWLYDHLRPFQSNESTCIILSLFKMPVPFSSLQRSLKNETLLKGADHGVRYSRYPYLKFYILNPLLQVERP